MGKELARSGHLQKAALALGRQLGVDPAELAELGELGTKITSVDGAIDAIDPTAHARQADVCKAAAGAELPPPGNARRQPPSNRATRARNGRESQADRRARRDREHVERFREKNRARFAAPHEDVPVHRRDTFRRLQAYQADESGRSLQWWLDTCVNKMFVQRLLESALVPLADGTYRYTLKHPRARRIVCIAILIYEHARKTRTGYVCRGLSEQYMRAVLADPWTGKRPCITAINGRHRPDGSVYNGQVGWLRALVECGALRVKQYKDPDVIAAVAQPWELSNPKPWRGVMRVWPMNWYTLPMRQDEAIAKLQRAELAEWLDQFEEACGWDPYAPTPLRDDRAQAPP